MKLKNVLILAFVTVTLIPMVAVSLLLYKSGYVLSKESYIRNLKESITVQTDYIVQTIENDMILDQRFARQHSGMPLKNAVSEGKSELYASFQSYLEVLGDKIAVCLLLDREDGMVYSVGEANVIEVVRGNLPTLSAIEGPTIMEFALAPGDYSLAMLTPILERDGSYGGCLVSVYDKAYLFKIISSYYQIADTATYICRANGEVINRRALENAQQNADIEAALVALSFTTEGAIDMGNSGLQVTGYYEKLGDTPWYLVGFIDNARVGDFTNQYVLTYILLIIGVGIAAMLLAFYFSRRVVEPINSLISVMEGYPDTVNSGTLQVLEKNNYLETRYLRSKFLELMQRILLVQHNFEGVYQLYQSGNMSDTNIDIDTLSQTISSNKTVFQKLMNTLPISPDACIVERFINCFCENDQRVLTDIFENMRDRQLSVPCEAEIYTPHLEEKWFHILVVPMYENNRLSHLFIQLRDITSFKKQEIASREKATRDSLTGLYNRGGFTQNVDKILQTSQKSAMHGFMFMDMDYFKMVNDNLGHVAGDDLLRSVGEVLRECSPCGSILSRFGGDEFAIFFPNTTQETLAQVKEALGQRLVYPFDTEKATFVVTASIGLSLWNGEAPYTFAELLQRADATMYQAKKRVRQGNAT